jgi:hypothetical protein
MSISNLLAVFFTETGHWKRAQEFTAARAMSRSVDRGVFYHGGN